MKKFAFKITLIAIISCVLGWFFVPMLNVKLNPSTGNSTIVVNYSWRSASPLAIERQITSVLEGSFATLQGVKKITSRSSLGNGRIQLELDKYADEEVLRFETANLIRQAYSQFPLQASYPRISVNKVDEDQNQRAFVSYSIAGSYAPFDIQEQLQLFVVPAIGSINGIDRAEVYGAEQKEYVIKYHQNQLQILGISKQEIVDAIQNYYDEQGVGEVISEAEQITLSIRQKRNIDWDIPIKKVDHRLIYLSDLAQIEEQEQETKSYYRVNAKNAINLAVYAENNANTIKLSGLVDEKIQDAIQASSLALTIKKDADSTEYLKTELEKIVLRFLYTVGILLLFVFLVSRNWRYVLHIFFHFVVSISLAFIFYYLFNIEIQLYSMAGLTISLGLVLDNIIVMLDHLKKQGNTSVFMPIVASTLTSMGALSLIYFLDEEQKQNLLDFAWIIIINLGVSLAVAKFLVPALWHLFPIHKTNQKRSINIKKTGFYRAYNKLISILLNHKKKLVVLIVLIFGIPLFMLPQKLENNEAWYEKLYNSTYGNQWFQEEVNYHLKRYIGGAFRLFSVYVYENSYYSRNEETVLYVNAAMEKGASVHQMNEAFLQIENYLTQFPEIENFTSYVYSGDYASIEIRFKDSFKEAAFPHTLKAKITKKALDLGGMNWSIYGVGKGFSAGSSGQDQMNFAVKARGYNYEQLNYWADSLVSILTQHPRVQKAVIKDNSNRRTRPRFAYRLDLNKDQMALRETNLLQSFDQLKQLSLSKFPDFSQTIGGRFTPLRFESLESRKFDFWELQNTPLFNLKNQAYKLNEIASIEQFRTEENIYKEQQEYLRKIEFQYAGSEKFGNIHLEESIAKLQGVLPTGYHFEKNSNRWSFSEETAQNYFILIVFIGIIIYFLCTILFESLTQPIIIISIIPISFIGVFLTFYLFDFNFDQGGMASFVILSGLTVNACIFILDEFNKQQKRNNSTSIQNFINAFYLKIFPILLTIISTILGFIPFVINGQNEVFWFALGVGTIGGLLFSLLAIFIYLPIFTLKKQQL
ncbi:MAG: efflux RND transporter permease subunit [Bacteroidota bacterium]